MRTKFGLVFSERDDGVPVWSAECQGCGTLLVGERSPQVTVVRVSEPMPMIQFDQLKIMVGKAWDNAKRTGHPIIVGIPGVTVESVHDHGDLQRALETHAAVCPASNPPG